MIHELKTWREPFEAMLNGIKNYEIRRFDRPFAVGDELFLREYDPDLDVLPAGDRYTGRSLSAIVTYVSTPGTWDLPANVGVLGVRVTTNTPGTRQAFLDREVARLARAYREAIRAFDAYHPDDPASRPPAVDRRRHETYQELIDFIDSEPTHG